MDGYLIVNILAALLILTSLLVVLTKAPRRAAYIYGAQAIVIVGMLVTLGVLTNSTELFTWAGAAFVTKVILVPTMVLVALNKMKIGKDEKSASTISPVVSIVVIAAEVFLCFLAVTNIHLPTALEVKPALAISLAHFFIGLTCIITQRNIVKQIFGYCLMENGSHISLALLAPQAPEVVEIGIATDAVFAVLIMVIMVVRVYRSTHTLDSSQIMNDKG